MKQFKVLDLFSGIGGFSLGLERAGMKTIAFCEVNEFCRKILKKHWPKIPILTDITKIGIMPMSYAEDSPARMSVMPGNAPDYPESVPVSGGGYAEAFAWYDRNTQSWRTWQRCLIEGWARYSETWPRSGMTRNGIAYRLPPLVPLTNVTERGLLQTERMMLPTIGASEYIGSSRKRYRGSIHFRGAKTSEGLRNSPNDPMYLNPSFAEAMMGYPKDYTLLETL